MLTETVVRFTRRLTAAADEGEALSVLVRWATRHAGASAGVVLEASADGRVRVVAPRGLTSSDEEDDTDRIRSIAARFPEERTLLVSCRDGVSRTLLLLYRHRADPERLRLAAALVAIASASLWHARRYEELRREGASMVHDLRNALSPLPLLACTAKTALASHHESAVATDLDRMMAVLNQAFATADRLRNGKRDSSAPTGPVDVNAAVEHAVRIGHARVAQRPAGSPRVNIDVAAGTPPPAFARSGELVAAVANLLVNAVDALEAGGRVRVATFASHGQAMIVVDDDGPGIPPGLRKRVFEPYFTTKGPRGSGLGLAMVRDFARRSGGALSLRTAPGRGATFTLALRAFAKRAEPSRVPSRLRARDVA